MLKIQICVYILENFLFFIFPAKISCSEKEEFDCYGDGSYCIPRSKVCDGHNDCQHREDEETSMCKRKCFYRNGTLPGKLPSMQKGSGYLLWLLYWSYL